MNAALPIHVQITRLVDALTTKGVIDEPVDTKTIVAYFERMTKGGELTKIEQEALQTEIGADLTADEQRILVIALATTASSTMVKALVAHHTANGPTGYMAS